MFNHKSFAMKKTKLIFCVFALIWPSLAFTQNQTTTAVIVHPKRFQVGDMYYASSFKGLQSFMRDLQVENPELHQRLSPDFLAMKRSRDAANATWIASGVIGSTLMVGAFTFWQDTKTVFKPGDAFYDPNAKEPSLAVLASAFGVYVAGGLLGILIYPGDDKIYNFINSHNRHSPEQKLNWQLGVDVSQNLEPGLKLTMRF